MKNTYITTSQNEEYIESTLRIPAHTSLGEYLTWASSFSQNDANKKPCEKATESNQSLFLSILMRTQGTRIQEINEALLCLAAQTDTDFEILLMAHNVDPRALSELQCIIEDQPLWLQDKIRYIPVLGGTRTLPLNEGFRAARGRYLSIFDDDDIVFDTWVEEFHAAATQTNNLGKIIHSYTFTQKWKTGRAQASERWLCATSSPAATYCHPFNAAEELFLNHAPTLSLAFPVYVFQELGIEFQDDLTTTEDWNYLMKAYLVCGICESEATTSLYRLWENSTTSHTSHHRDEWAKNYWQTASFLDSIPLLLGTGTRTAMQKQTSALGSELTDTVICETCTLFYNWSKEAAFEKLFSKPTLINEYFLEFNGSSLPPIENLTFRPTNHGYITVSSFSLVLVDAEGNEHFFDFSHVKTNGQQVDSGHVLFLQRLPEIYLDLKNPLKIDYVRVRLHIEPGAASHHLDQAMRGSFSLWAGRTRRWILRRLGLGE